jgi:hypothetical protein
LSGGYVVWCVAEQDCCAVVEVETVGFLGPLAGYVDETGESAVEVLAVPRNQRFDLPCNRSGHMRVVIGVRPVGLGD